MKIRLTLTPLVGVGRLGAHENSSCSAESWPLFLHVRMPSTPVNYESFKGTRPKQDYFGLCTLEQVDMRREEPQPSVTTFVLARSDQMAYHACVYFRP